jgi:hypothetical protein
MAATTEFKGNWKEEKVDLHNALTALKISMSDYKEKRKTEWKSFKNKFNEDMVKVESSLKKLTSLHKK